MRFLIVEDDLTSRLILQKSLADYGECVATVNGIEAVQAFKMAMQEKRPYDLICMDIMMPDMDGQEALQNIRRLEKELQVPADREVRVVMTSALDDPQNVIEAMYEGGATDYLVKPLSRSSITGVLRKLKLIH